MFLNSINNFRAISIIFIVAGHCFVFFGNISILSNNTLISRMFLNLILGGSTLFVIISGFLFHHVYYRKFQFKKFYLKKIKYVLIPYIILTTLAVSIVFFKCLYKLNSFENLLLCFSNINISKYYFTGMHFFIGYWYIPFVMILFLLTPLFVSFVRLKITSKIIIVTSLLLVSFVLHRGDSQDFYAILQNVVFYIPVFLLGITLSERKDIIYSKLKGKDSYLLVIVLLLAFSQSYLGKLGTYEKAPFLFQGLDLMLIQKIVFSLFFLIWLKRFENFKSTHLNLIAECSFGIYFIHGIIIWVIEVIKPKLNLTFSINQFYIYIIYFIVIFYLSLFVTYLIKKKFPKYSRYLIGS
ncbi:peptidoglycan/LPS O-acetylase OafA/YrhL [Cellulophaga sp. RHA_52]|uniref:acyltransferase family protein n=1 Tax=Cellulophaga sp. RHA_52 TaxID=1250036 RepID=UPI00119BBE3D|nr:acyltransferase [Cellulophaga sp. RHA_52]TVZ10242.1 peptidoglycan/LPS O-acetylase OafA/YrhL [Cellulophaga sp. RHA_52]